MTIVLTTQLDNTNFETAVARTIARCRIKVSVCAPKSTCRPL